MRASQGVSRAMTSALLRSVRSRSHATRTSSRRSERGESLVELILAVLILGTVSVAVLATLTTTIIASDLHRKKASANVVLISSLESVKDLGYVACDTATTSTYDPSLNVTFPAGWSAANVAVTSVKGWDGTAWAPCTSGSTDTGLELVTVEVTSNDGNASVSADVVKRDG